MGGLPCAKTIIDQRNAVVQVMDCMSASILLNAPNGTTPTEEMEDEFVKAANALAMVAVKIEHYVRTGDEPEAQNGDGPKPDKPKKDKDRDKGKAKGNGEGL